MSPTDALKLLEAGVLLLAGVALGWWQLRDVAKARQASRRAAQYSVSPADAPLNTAASDQAADPAPNPAPDPAANPARPERGR